MVIERLTTLDNIALSHVPHYSIAVFGVSRVHDWPLTCLFRMDHHVARDIRRYRASAVPSA